LRHHLFLCLLFLFNLTPLRLIFKLFCKLNLLHLTLLHNLIYYILLLEWHTCINIILITVNLLTTSYVGLLYNCLVICLLLYIGLVQFLLRNGQVNYVLDLCIIILGQVTLCDLVLDQIILRLVRDTLCDLVLDQTSDLRLNH